MSFAQGGVSFTPAQYRQNSRIPLDTPTPASTSGHNSAYMSSLKPARHHSILSYDLSFGGAQNIAPSGAARGGGGGVGGKVPIKLSQQQQQQQQFYRAPLGPSGNYYNNNKDLNTEDLNLDNLDIPTDDTERDRRIMEEDLKREFSALRRDDAESDRDSAGFGDLSDLENGDGMGGMRNLRREMEDESVASSSNSSDLGDDFSLHIGMTGVRGGKNEVRPSAPIQRDSYEEEDRDLTYVSVDSPRRPVTQHQHHHQQKQQQQQHASTIPLPPSRESSAAPSSKQPTRRTIELVDNFPSRPTQYQQQTKPSPTLPSRTSAYEFNATKVPSNTQESEYPRSHLDYSSDRVRLPDVTGLTEGLQSPTKVRGYPQKPSPRRTQAQAQAQAVPNVGGAGLYEALDSLRARLASSERDRSTAGNKVRDLESRLHEESVRQQSNAGIRRSDSEGLQSQLRNEKEKAAALRTEVNRLRSQVVTLTQTTESHNASIAALQSQQNHKVHHESSLRSEVHAIRTGLERLGNEVSAVKGDLTGLMRDKAVSREWEREERERQEGMKKAAGRKDERPKSRTEQVRGDENEDPDRTPRAGNRTYRFDAPASPKTGNSFIPREEFAGYQAELEEQQRQARASPTPRPKRTTVTYAEQQNPCTRPHLDSAPPRPATAPLPLRQSAPAPPQHQQQQQVPRHSRDPLQPRTNNAHTHTSEDVESRERYNRAEKIFDSQLCTVCKSRRSEGAVAGERAVGGSAPPKMQSDYKGHEADDEGVDRRKHETAARTQAARGRAEKELMTVLRNKEADFEHQKRLYLELSREYEGMNAKVNGAKRQMLADHLKSSIDDLELKADMVRGLHDLLHRSSATH